MTSAKYHHQEYAEAGLGLSGALKPHVLTEVQNDGRTAAHLRNAMPRNPKEAGIGSRIQQLLCYLSFALSKVAQMY